MRRSQIRRATQRATTRATRLLDVALCRALAHRMEHAARHNPAVIAGMDDLANGRTTHRQHPDDQPRAKIVTRLVIPQIPGDATMRRILDTMRAEGWGTSR